MNLHWIGGEMASVKDIGRIKKPVIWTLHDMWAFCGAEHYTLDKRWCDGYKKNNRLSNESGFDINRWTWKRKMKHWKNPFQIVAVSNWLVETRKNNEKRAIRVVKREYLNTLVNDTKNILQYQNSSQYKRNTGKVATNNLV